MTQDNVVTLPVITTLDLNVERVLDEAIKEDLDCVLVIGFTKEGDFYFAANQASGPDNLWLLAQAQKELLEVSYPE